MNPSKHGIPLGISPLPSLRKDMATVAGPAFRADLRRYDCATTRDWSFAPTKPYLSLSLGAGTMRRTGTYRCSARRVEPTDLGQLFLVPANAELQLHFGPGVRDTLSCTFDLRELAELDDLDWTDDALACTLDIRNPGARDALWRLVSEMRSPGPASRLVIEAAMLLAAVELYRQFTRSQAVTVNGALAPWQVRKIMDRIAEAPAESVSLRELAADCRISPRHLMRSFKAATGKTIGACLTEAKIREAAVLLTDPAIPIKQIAHRCGFQSVAAFTTAFRRVTGATPGSLRGLSGQPIASCRPMSLSRNGVAKA